MKKLVSIVLTTYNGKKYLIEQMESLRQQTYEIDEVFILDDCSTDGTGELVSAYIKEHNLYNWHFKVNEVNQGWKKNFKNGFDLCSGDYIFPCDQDDIWCLDKVERMVECMENNPDINLLTSNYDIFYSEKNNGQNSYDKKMTQDGSLERIFINPKWCYIARPGCTYCFRRSFYNEIKDNWDTNYAHDALLWRYACMKNSLAVLNVSLINFRRHANNTTSSIRWTKNSRIKVIDDYLYFYEVAYNFVSSEKDIRELDRGKKFLETRKLFLTKRNIRKFFILLLKYKKYYYSYKGVLVDLYFAFK